MPRRAAILVLIALALGAVTTVAVAWIVAANRPNGSGSIPKDRWRFTVGEDVVYWGAVSTSAAHSIAAFEAQTREHYRLWRERANIAEREHPALGETARWMTIPTPDPGYFYVTNAFGWPSHALRGLVVEGPLTPTRQMTVLTEYWFFGHPDDPRTIALPLGIIWPGFLINTLAYAAAWFVLLFAAHRVTHVLVTRRRLRRGTCPACRYDLLGEFSSGCPECGWNRAGSVVSAPHSGQTPDSLPERS